MALRTQILLSQLVDVKTSGKRPPNSDQKFFRIILRCFPGRSNLSYSKSVNVKLNSMIVVFLWCLTMSILIHLRLTDVLFLPLIWPLSAVQVCNR